MPRLLVVRWPCVTRGLAVQELSQTGNGQFASGPVVEKFQPRLDDADIEQVRYSMFGA